MFALKQGRILADLHTFSLLIPRLPNVDAELDGKSLGIPGGA
jgi:hypothetical protein